MADEQKTSRKMRSITSTFTLRDVAVVAVAAFTAAGPFFAYDTRISVAESKIEDLTEAKVEIKEMIKDLKHELTAHVQEYRSEKKKEDAEVVAPPPNK